MKRLCSRAVVPLAMLLLSAVLCVYVYRMPGSVADPLPVLMYHHMVPDGQDCNDMTVTPGKFRADLETVLAMGYTPVLPRELAAGDALPEKPAAQSAGASAQSSGKLATPTNLRWETAYKEYMEEHDGLSYFEKVYPGCISWDDSKNSVEDYCIVFYDASGNEVCRSYWVKDPEMDSYHADDFLTHIEVSGTYRFSVQAIDEDDPSRNSEIAYSDWWPYYRPNQTLDVPVGLYADAVLQDEDQWEDTAPAPRAAAPAAAPWALP